MRTAFCFSGELRSLDKTYPLIKERIMDKFSDYDIFVFTWKDDPDLDKLSIFEKDPHVKNILLGKRITLDEKTYETQKREEVNIQGMLRQLHCLKKCNNMKKLYEKDNKFKYDIVVRIRPDLLVLNNTKLEKSVETWDMKNYVYTVDHDDHIGYNDRFYFSNSDNMDFLSNRLDMLEYFYDLGGSIHYETFFKYCIFSKGLKICRSNLQFVLLRTDGSASSELMNYYDIGEDLRFTLKEYQIIDKLDSYTIK